MLKTWMAINYRNEKDWGEMEYALNASSYVDRLRGSSVLESEVHLFPDAPIRVDTAFPDQFGLRPHHVDETHAERHSWLCSLG